MQSRARGSPAVRAATGRNGITPPTGTCAHVHRRSRMYHRLRSTAAIGAAIAALALAACSDNPTPTAPTVKPSARVGNGFPQGAADYHLNIIGVPKDKSVPLDNNSGARIFVQLYSSNTVTSPAGSTTLNISLFDDCFQNYFWNYDNNGLKNLEVRFYKAG